MNKLILLLSVLLFSFPLITICQQGESYTIVGDTTVNLKKVDDNGILLNSSRIQSSTTGITKELEERLYASKDGDYYLIAWDSSSYLGYGGIFSSKFVSYTKDGHEIFTKLFDNLTISKVFILKEGEKYIIKLGSEEDIRFIIYDKVGNELKDILNQEVYLYSEDNGRLIIYQTEDKENELHLCNYDKKDETIITFREKVLVTNISPSEEYFTVRCDDSLIVYNRFGDYHFGLKNENQTINILAGDSNYFINYPYPIGKIEVRDFQNHKPILNVDYVEYNGKKLPIYQYGEIENDNIIWVSNYFDRVQVFNFIDMQGKLINICTTPSSVWTNEVTFKKVNNEYQAIY